MEFLPAPSSDELVALRDASVFCIEVADAYVRECSHLSFESMTNRIAVNEVELTALLREQHPFIEQAWLDWRKNAAATTLDWLVMARGSMKPVRHREFITSTAHEMGFKLIDNLKDVVDRHIPSLTRSYSELPVATKMRIVRTHLLHPSFLSPDSGFDRDEMVAEVRLEHASARRLLIDKGFATPSPMVSTVSEYPAGQVVQPEKASFVDESKQVMTDGQKRLWDALAGRALTAKELASKSILDTSEDTVRRWVFELRKAGYEIDHRRGRGYVRPDARPADSEPPTAT